MEVSEREKIKRELLEEIKEKRRQQQRNWYKKNKEKVKKYNERYWTKKVLRQMNEEGNA